MKKSLCGASLWALILCASGVVLLSAQTQPPLNPPALPAGSTGGTFGAPLPGTPTSGNSIGNVGTPTVWAAAGPAPLTENGGPASGRIAGIAIDTTTSPNGIFVAAAGGGVWKSADGGATYTPLTDTQASLAMGAIAIAPTNHLHIYAGTGEGNNSVDSNFGRGMLVSIDGGSTWALSKGPGNAFDRAAFTKISVDPTNELNAFAAVATAGINGVGGITGIYKTTDGGVTWTNTTTAIDMYRSWTDVVVDPNSPSIVYAAIGYIFGNANNGIYRSINGGSTWNLLANPPSGTGVGRIALAVGASASTMGSHVLYAAYTIANGTANGGKLYEMIVSQNADAATPTFTILTTTPNFGGSGAQGWYDWIIAVNPGNASVVYCAGALNYDITKYHVIQTTNGLSGTTPTWNDLTTINGVQPHTDSHAMAFDSSNNMYLGNDGGIWQLNTSNTTWSNLNGNLNTIQFTGIGLHPSKPATLLGGSQDNGTEYTTGSTNWTNVPGSGDGGYSQISQTMSTTFYSNHPIGSFGPTSFFQVSLDGGNSWNSQTPAISNQNGFDFYAPIFVDPLNGMRVFLGGDALYESPNSAGTWTAHAAPATPIDSIAVLPGGNTIYISTGGSYPGNSSKVWYSTNDGGAYTEVDLPGGLHVQELDIDPNDSTGQTAVAVSNSFNGGAGQVFRTINGGTAWTNISGNLPAIPTWSAKIDTDFNKTIYVSNETGVYYSPSPYTTWTALGTGLPNAQGVSLQLNTTTHLLGLGTHGRGAWTISTSIVNYQAPTISKSFSPSTITSGGTSTVTVTLTNPNSTLALTGAAFSDTLTNMSVGSTVVGGNCTGVTPSGLTLAATSVSFSGISIAAGSSCTVTFVVTSTNVAVNPNTTSGVTTTQTPTAGSPSATVNLTVNSAVSAGPTVVSYNVICGTACTYNMIGSTRNRLPWQVTAIKVVFSQAITSANINSLTGVTATGFSGLGTTTLTWTVAAITNSHGSLSTALATAGPNAIQSANGALTGSNTSASIKVLEGDINDDGIVNSLDLTLANNGRSALYSIYNDVNGDGTVNTTDMLVVKNQTAQSNP